MAACQPHVKAMFSTARRSCVNLCLPPHMHMRSPPRQVVVSAPVKDTPAVLNIVVGCNEVRVGAFTRANASVALAACPTTMLSITL